MLFKETINQQTLELLKTFMRDEVFNDFILVGGTALSLKIGHRISIDLDMFSTKSFDQETIADHLRKNYSFNLDFISDNTIKGTVNEIQLDCISHQYQLLAEPVKEEGIRIAGLIDIAAMKLNAISGNGTRLKDFVDVAYLSSEISFYNMLEGYQRKYKSNPVMPLKAITYFDDIDFNQPIKMSGNKTFRWKTIENRLKQMQNKPNNIFETID